ARRGRPGREPGRTCSWRRTAPRRATAGCPAGIEPAPRESAGAMSFLALNPIPRLARHDPADAAPRIGDIARPAWDDVDVSVQHGLPCRRAVVDAEVEPIGLSLVYQPAADQRHQPPEGGLLLFG